MNIETHLGGMVVDQGKVKQLFKNLVLAYQRQSRKKKTIDAVHGQVAKIKQVAVQRAPKKVVEEEVKNLQDMLSSLFNEEKAMLTQQREETRMLLELRARLDDMEKRVLRQPQMAPAMESMRELHAINQALHKISSRLDEEAARVEQVKRGEAAESATVAVVAAKEDATARKVMEIEAQLSLIERKHQQLREAGHNKQQLKKLRVLIEKHRKRLERLKKKKR